jgi:hypothetical protein
VLDYWLKDAAQGAVTLDIVDAKGKPVRHFSSTDKLTPPDLSKIDATAEWFPQRTPLLASAGMHRFIWDLRYAAPEALGHGSGVWILPGSYTVKLTVDGKTHSQALTVKNDPRVKTSVADLAKQQALAFQIEAERAKLSVAGDEVSAVLRQLESLQAKAAPDLAARLKAFEMELSAQTELHAVPPGYGQPGAAPAKVGSLAYVTGAMDALQPAVENADGAPSPDAQKGFALQKANAAKAIAAWQSLKASRVPALDTDLKAAGLPALGSAG